MENTKKCTKCLEVKTFDNFYTRHDTNRKYKTEISKLQPSCKICWKQHMKNKRNGEGYQKNVDLKHSFGITLDDYNKLLDKQNSCCKICKRHESQFKRKLAVDHCHTTGKIRGLLCSQCNTALGKLKEDINILNSMIDYIKKHEKS